MEELVGGVGGGGEPGQPQHQAVVPAVVPPGHSTVQYSTVQYSTGYRGVRSLTSTQYSTVQYSTVYRGQVPQLVTINNQ